MLRQSYNTWQCGTHTISLARPRIMGVLNVTPDSFSDGGKNFDPEAAIARGLQMLDEGADIIDVGGESTRPGHTPVLPTEEAERVVPVVRALVAAGAIVSIDTRHAEVAKMCVRLGASIINDVSGFTDPEMVAVAAESDCGCIVMHWNKDGLGARVERKQVQLDDMRPSRPTGSA
ncbi:MAG: dihydropteroate synthase, partial [Atopobium sp.]|nr:dihydropteroate synthase [Atopobium sp.]